MNTNDKIRIFRTLHGLSQQDLADFAGVPRTAVAKWEKGIYLPRRDAALNLGKDFANWIFLDEPLRPQLFVPLLSGVSARQQTINAWNNTISDLGNVFLDSTGASSVHEIIYADGSIFRFADHLLIAAKPMLPVIRDNIEEGRSVIRYPASHTDRLMDIIQNPVLFLRLLSEISPCIDYDTSRLDKLLWRPSRVVTIHAQLPGGDLTHNQLKKLEIDIHTVFQKHFPTSDVEELVVRVH